MQQSAFDLMREQQDALKQAPVATQATGPDLAPLKGALRFAAGPAGLIGADPLGLGSAASDLAAGDDPTQFVGGEVQGTAFEQMQQRRAQPLRRSKPLTAADRFSQALEEWPRLLPFISSAMEAGDAKELWTAARAMEGGTATDEQRQLVFDFLDKNQTPRTFGYKVVDILAGAVPFAAEFAVTRGAGAQGRKAAESAVARIVREAVEEGAEKTVKRSLLKRVAGGAGEAAGFVAGQAAGQAAAGLVTGNPLGGAIQADAYRRAFNKAGAQLTEDDAGRVAVTFAGSTGDFLDSLPQAIANQLIEVGSELSGSALMKLPVANRIAGAQTAVLDWWLKKYPSKAVPDFLNLVASKTKWDGPVGEFLEERAGDLARGLTPGMEETLADAVPTSLEDFEQWAAELVAFSIPTGLGGVATAVDSKLQKDAPTLDADGSRTATDAPGGPVGANSGATDAQTDASRTPPVGPQTATEIDPATVPDAAAPMGRREGAEPQRVVHAAEIPDRQKRKRFGTASKLAERFGLRAVPVASESGEALTKPAMAGGPGVVYLDVNADVIDQQDRGGVETRGRVMHELVHELAAVDAETYSALQAGIEKHVSPEVRNAVLEDYRQRLGQEIPEEIRDEEMVANLTEGLAPLLMLADQAHGQATLERIARDDFGLFAKILDAVKRLANRFGGDFATRAEQELESFGISRDKIGAQEAANAARLVHQALTRALEGRQAATISSSRIDTQDQAGAEAPSTTAEPVDPGASEVPAGTPVGRPLPGRAADLPSTFTSTQQAKTERKLRRAERAARTLREQAEKATPEEAAKLRARAAYQDERAKDYRHQLDIDADLKVGEQAREIQDEAARRRPFEAENFPRRREETRTERARRIAEEGEENPDAFAAPGRPAVGVRRVYAHFNLGEEGRTDAFLRYMADRELRLFRMDQAIEQYTGEEVAAEDSTFRAIERLPGKIGERVRQFVKTYRKPMERLLEKAEAAGYGFDAALRYLYARHAPERNAWHAERDKAFADVNKNPGSGMGTKEANEYVEKANASEAGEHLKALGELYDQMNRETLRTMLDGGLISQETYDELTERWQHYAPLRTSIEGRGPGSGGGGKFGVRGKEFQQTKGRTTEADNVLGFALWQGLRAISRAEKNQVGAAFEAQIRKSLPKREYAVDEQEPAEPEIDELGFLRDESKPPKIRLEENEYGYKKNGRQVIIRLNDQLLARALNGLNGTSAFHDSGVVGKLLRFQRDMMRKLAAVNTSLSLSFMVGNALRDSGQAYVTLRGERGAKAANQIARDVMSGGVTGALWRVLGEKEGGKRTEWDERIERFLAAGGKVDYFFSKDPATIEKELREAFALKGGNAWDRARYQGRKLGDLVDLANAAIENSWRAAAFYRLQQPEFGGLSEAEAASVSKNLTINFNRKGELAEFASLAWMFWSPAVGGTKRAVEAMKNRRVQQILGGLSATSFALTLYNLSAGDGDDGEPAYLSIPEWERENNLIFMLPGGEVGMKLPLPYFFNLAHVVGEKAALVAAGEVDARRAATDTVQATIKAANPWGEAPSALATISPTMLRPLVEITTNENFAGNPIMPEQNPFGVPKPDSQRAFRSVDPRLDAFAKWMNKTFGGDEVTPGSVDVSPETLEHVIGFATGAMGRDLMQFASLPERAYNSLAKDQPFDWNKVPAVRRVVAVPAPWHTSKTYYDHKGEVELLEAQLKLARENRDAGRMRSLRTEKRHLWSLRGRLEATEKRLKRLRDQRDASSGDRQQQIEERIRKEQDRFNRAYYEARRRGEDS